MFIENIVWMGLQGLIYIFIAPLVVGCLRYSKARLVGRRGPPLFQTYFDLWKLLLHPPIVPNTASWVFSVAPYLIFGCYIFLGLVVPLIFLPQPPNDLGQLPMADLLLLVYVLGLIKFITGLAGLDAGIAFSGLGSAREMFLQVLIEPALILAVYAMTLNAHSTSLTVVLNFNRSNILEYFPVNLLIILALISIALAEAGRLPFDNPETHLELTMIGKAIHLEYAGRHLAMLEWAEALRMTFFLTLLINFTLPFAMAYSGESILFNLGMLVLYPVKVFFLTEILAFVETLMARLRLGRLSNSSVWSLTFSLFAILLTSFNH
jgi:formate hydrogenlyase subunit 4